MMGRSQAFLGFCLSSWGWMEKGGVVPWLLLRTFRLLPILPFLLARRLRVTRVRETISALLPKHENTHRFEFLPQLFSAVKNLLAVPAFFLPFALAGAAHAGEKGAELPLILGKGEVEEIKVLGVIKYAVGNKEVLKVRPKGNSSTLILKGIRMGSSDLMVWRRTGAPKRYQVIVVSKRQQLKWAQWPPLLSPLGIKAQYQAGGLNLQGRLKNYSRYLLFKALFTKAHLPPAQKGKLPFWETDQLILSEELKRKIQEEVFYLALKSYRDDLDCSFRKVFLQCHFQASLPLPKVLKKQMEEKALIRWFPLPANPREQFKLKLVLFQFESDNGRSIELGLDRLEGKWGHVFSQGPASFIQKNKVLLGRQETIASTLAEPQLVIRPGEPGKIHIGSQIPFKTQDSALPSLQWKFAGLKIEVKATPRGDKILLQYKTELTHPAAQGKIAGSRESSQVLVTPGRPFKLFEIGYQAMGDHHSSLPLISRIPLLGKLFTSSQKKQSYKKISALLILERMSD